MEDTSKAIAIIKTLKYVMNSMRKNVAKEFEDMKLTGPQGMIMGIVCHEDKIKISDLSKRLGLSNSTISGIVDRLEKQGYVERVRSKEDRRVVYVNVTSEFRENAKNNFHSIKDKIESKLDKVTEEDLDKILEGLNILKDIVDKEDF